MMRTNDRDAQRSIARRAGEAVRKPRATIASGSSTAEAARLMDRLAVGALVVVEGERPVDLVTLAADADLHQAITVFYRHPIRRLPLIEDGRMVGMLTVDDLVIDLVNDLDSLVRPVFGQVIFGGPDLQETTRMA